MHTHDKITFRDRSFNFAKKKRGKFRELLFGWGDEKLFLVMDAIAEVWPESLGTRKIVRKFVIRKASELITKRGEGSIATIILLLKILAFIAPFIVDWFFDKEEMP